MKTPNMTDDEYQEYLDSLGFPEGESSRLGRSSASLDLSQVEQVMGQEVASLLREEHEAGEVDLSPEVGFESHAISDDDMLRAFEDELSGDAGRRRAVANVEAACSEREEWWLEHCRANGGPLPSDLEYLRPQLQDCGY